MKRAGYKNKTACKFLRRLICPGILLMSFLLGAVPCPAAADTETVRVAVINYPNFIQKQEDGSIHGYAYEYLEEIRLHTGWKYEYIEMSFAEASDALDHGTIDLLAGSQYTPEREAHYDFSARDMGEGGSVLCVALDDMRYCYNDYAAYDGIKIAAMTGTVRIEQTKEKLAQYGVSAKFIEYDTDEESKAALRNKEVDAVLMSTIRCESKYKILARIKTAPLYFCINKQRPKLKQELDKAMEEIHLNEPYYEEKLDEKYYGTIPIQLAFTDEEKAYIASAAPITVACNEDLIPLEYYSSEDDRYRGVVPDSFEFLEENSGLTFRFVRKESVDILRKQLTSGEVQLVASVVEDQASADQLGVILTRPYRDNSLSLVINDNVSDYRDTNCTLVLSSGYPYLDQLAQIEGYQNLIHADTFDDCITMVEKRHASIALVPSNCADILIRKHAYTDLDTYLLPDSNMNSCIGIGPQADPLLLSILNKSIAALTKDHRTELLIQNLAVANQTVTLHDFIASHCFNILLIVLAIAIMIIIIVYLFAMTLKHSNQRLQVALQKADAASNAKTEYLARMSHDMRTPMNGILGLSHLMEDQTDTAEIKKELPKLREAGEYLLQLINDVLDVNKIESGKIELHPTVCSEEQLFSSVISMVKPQMEEKSIDFHFQKNNVEWEYILLDEQRVKQIFMNLFSNAIKFTPQGGQIEFIMEPVSKDEHMVHNKFILRDTGIGISKEFMPRLFNSFAQENRLSKNAEGTGLGLAIVKSLVDLMEGTISVESQINEGTVFTLDLHFPLAERPEAVPVSEDSAAQKQFQNIKILLCEDQLLNAQIVIRLLEKQGAEVIWKENGQLGTDAFMQSDLNGYDVILMDIRMPVMDGIEAAKVIRALERPDAQTVPIIAITANVYEEDIQKSLDAGMNAFLAKPIEPAVMYKIIAAQLSAE